MTVETEVSSIRYTGIIDGVPLAAPFPVQTTDEIVVYYNSDLIALLGTHYTVALDPPDYETATVTPLSGFSLLSGGVVTINREIPYLNPDDIPAHSTLASSRLEQGLDRSVFMSQQLRDQLARALKFLRTDPTSSYGPVPSLANRANKLLGFDPNGVPIAYDPGPANFYPRVRLPADTNFYVRPGGNDNNNGLINTDAGAFASPQGAWNYLQQNVDCMGHRPSVRVSGGGAPTTTYSTNIIIGGTLVGAGVSPCCEFIGDVTSPTPTIIINGGGSNAVYISNSHIRLAGFKITTSAGGGGSNLSLFDNTKLFHHHLWLADAGHEYIECHQGSNCLAEGPTIVSGVGDSFCHFTENSQIGWENFTITCTTSDGVTLGTPSTGPKFENYIFGGNRATCTLGRSTVVGSFGCDVSHLSRHFIHIGATLNLSSCVGLDGLFPGQSPPQNETAGTTAYDNSGALGVATIYVNPVANSDNTDGYRDSIYGAFLNHSVALARLSIRPPDQIYPLIPVLQFKGGYGGGVHLIPLPGVAEVILLGDETTPANCFINTTGAHCFESAGTAGTIYHIRGFKMASVSGSCLSAIDGGRIKYQNCEFAGSGAATLNCGRQASIISTGPAKCTAAAPQFINCTQGDVQILHTIEFLNSFAWGSQGVFVEGGNVRWTGAKTLTGPPTGNRTLVRRGGKLDLGGAAQNTLPGNADVAAEAATFGLIY